MVIFRGDYKHAGAAYTNEYCRLYFKAIPIGCCLWEEEINSVGYGYVCERVQGGCVIRCNGGKSLDNHKPNCFHWRNVFKRK